VTVGPNSSNVCAALRGKRWLRRFTNIEVRAFTFPTSNLAPEVPGGSPLRAGLSQVSIGSYVTRERIHIILFEVLMGEPSYEELKAKLAQLEKEVEVKKRSGDLIFKVGEKGGVSVYGLGRFPVTLYYEQWNRLLGAADEIKAFLEENKSKLKLKDQG
jgi:hypothetical protein